MKLSSPQRRLIREADVDIRELERRWKASDTPEDQERYFKAIQRRTGVGFVLVWSGTHYGRGEPLPFNLASQRVQEAYEILHGISYGEIRYGQDVDFYFIAVAHPEFLHRLINSQSNEISIHSSDYIIEGSEGDVLAPNLEQADHFNLTPLDQTGRFIEVLVGSYAPDWWRHATPLNPAEDPIQIWVDQYWSLSPYAPLD